MRCKVQLWKIIGVFHFKTMDEITDIIGKKNHSKWLRPVLVVIPVIAILTALFIWQPWSAPTVSHIIDGAREVTADLQSYQVMIERTSDTEDGAYRIEIEFSAPDRYHYLYTGDGLDMEVILIGEVPYLRDVPGDSFGVSTWTGPGGYSSVISSEYTARTLDYLTDIERLPDEVIDGTDCFHYEGTYDWEKQLREIFSDDSASGRPPLSEAQLQERIEEEREEAGTTTINVWIGKEDYLIRKMERVTQRPDMSGVVRTSTQIMSFSGFNEPIEIAAPVDSQGNLLLGWVTTAPDYPHFSMELQVEIDNNDPSNRQVDFSITLTNISGENLTDVDVRIIPDFPDREDNPDANIWHRWESGQLGKGPFTLEPSESLQYGTTFGYDATSITTEIIAETIDNSYVEISYIPPGGQLKIERLHFDAPASLYTLSTEVPPQFVPIDIVPSGEYRIKEEGAIYTGNGVTGEINGKDYLFLEINTSRDESVPAGILVLDVHDKTRPKKAGYINTGDDNRYLRAVSLYGTVLYVSVDDALWVIDVSDPSNPEELSRLPGLDTNQMIIIGKYALMNDGRHDIVTLDLSDPVGLKRVGNLPLSSVTSLQMDVYGEYLLAEANDVLYTIDASSPTSLEIVNETSFRGPLTDDTPDITYPYHIMGTEIEGDYAYVSLSAEGSLAIGVLDLSEPARPREIAFHILKDRTFTGSLFVYGDRIYTFTRRASTRDFWEKRLDVIDVSNPAEPRETGFGYMPETWSFFPESYGGSHQTFSLIDGYLYWFIGDEPNMPVIEVFDLSKIVSKDK